LPPKYTKSRGILRKFDLIAVQGHPRSLILAPIESTYMTFYLTSVVNLVLSCRVSEILEHLYAKSHFFHTPFLFRPKFWGVPLGVDPYLGVGGIWPYISSRSSKVIDFGTNRKHVYDFLFDLSSKLGHILPRFTDIRAFVRQKPLFPYPISIPAKILGCSSWSRSIFWDLRRPNTQVRNS